MSRVVTAHVLPVGMFLKYTLTAYVSVWFGAQVGSVVHPILSKPKISEDFPAVTATSGKSVMLLNKQTTVPPQFPTPLALEEPSGFAG